MSDERPNYTDEECFTIIELQLGLPAATNPNRGVSKKSPPPAISKSEGEYYNEVTELLFLLIGGTMNSGQRINEVRKKFYEKHGIMVMDTAQSSRFNAYVEYTRGGGFDFSAIKR